MKTKFIIKNRFARFLILGFGIYAVWYFFIEVLFFKYLGHNYSVFLANISTSLLNMFSKGYTNETIYISCNLKPLVYVHESCSGLGFFGIFLSFVIAFPANTKSKVWFLPIGLLGIFSINVIRISLLAIIANNYSQYIFNIIHQYIFVFIIYLIIILTILWWSRKNIIPEKQEKE